MTCLDGVRNAAHGAINNADAMVDAATEWVLPGLNAWQEGIDTAGAEFEEGLKGFVEAVFGATPDEITEWLKSNGEGPWEVQLGTSLAKMPLRAACMLVSVLYSILKAVLFAIVHPLKAITNIGRFIVDTLHRFATNPSAWTQTGATIIGGCLGAALVLGNPVGMLGMAIGLSFILIGLVYGALKAAVEKNEGWEGIGAQLLEQFEEMGTQLIFGFFMGMIVGGIEKAAQPGEPQPFFRYEDGNSPAWLKAQAYARSHGYDHFDFVVRNINNGHLIGIKNSVGPYVNPWKGATYVDLNWGQGNVTA